VAKDKDKKIKIPKKVLGYKLSKGSRKDLRKLIAMLESPPAKALALSAMGALIEHLGERAAEGKGPMAKLGRKAAAAARTH